MKRIILYMVVGLFTAFTFTSCEDDQAVEPKSFKVRMTDSPGNYAALNVTITSVDGYVEDHGWVTLSSQTQTINVASLTNGSEIVIADAHDVQTGFYTHLRIKFGGTATININATGSGSGLLFTLIWDSPQEVDILVNRQVTNNSGANVLLDFDVAQSIIQIGAQYHFQPVVREVHNEDTGVKGRTQGASTAAVVFTNPSHTYSGYINSDGYFFIRGMSSGTYTCTIYKNSESNEQHQINGIVVTQGQVYHMGTINLQ